MIELDLVAAQAIVNGALGSARAQSLKPIVVAVLDERGQLKAYAAEDGVSLGRFDIASGKANGALAMGVGSRTLRKTARENPPFIAAAASAIRGGLIPNPGGVLIRNPGGAIIGAVGVSGDHGERDEEAAIAGITAAGLAADPGAD